MDLTDRDRTDTSTDDPDRREEVEITAQLIVAANESGSSLSEEQIDAILGVSPRHARRAGSV